MSNTPLVFKNASAGVLSAQINRKVTTLDFLFMILLYSSRGGGNNVTTKTVAFTNMKGGVGKTILAYLTTTSLRKYLKTDMKILAIDLDPQANLTSKLLLKDYFPTIDEIGIHRFFGGDLQIKHCIVDSHFKGVKIIPSYIGLGLMEHKVLTSITGVYTLKQHLSSIANQFDLIVIDCPPNVGVFTLNGIMAANYIICPLSPDFAAFEGFKYLLSLLSEVQDPKEVATIVNLADRRYTQHKIFISTVNNAFDGKLNVLRPLSRRAAIQRAFEISKEAKIEAKRVHDDDTIKNLQSFLEDLSNFLGLRRNGEEE